MVGMIKKMECTMYLRTRNRKRPILHFFLSFSSLPPLLSLFFTLLFVARWCHDSSREHTPQGYEELLSTDTQIRSCRPQVCLAPCLPLEEARQRPVNTASRERYAHISRISYCLHELSTESRRCGATSEHRVPTARERINLAFPSLARHGHDLRTSVSTSSRMIICA
jgi:hypothetical protein